MSSRLAFLSILVALLVGCARPREAIRAETPAVTPVAPLAAPAPKEEPLAVATPTPVAEPAPPPAAAALPAEPIVPARRAQRSASQRRTPVAVTPASALPVEQEIPELRGVSRLGASWHRPRARVEKVDSLAGLGLK